jgi:uncharacterized membrane protein
MLHFVAAVSARNRFDMWSFESGQQVPFEIVSRRNNSSSPRARLLVFGSLGLFTLLVAAGFALIGAWPVAPFAGIECCALYVAYSWLKRHDEDYESITFEGDDVVVETRDGTVVARNRISRFWAQVIVETCPNGRRRVLLRAHGRDIEFGRLLSDEAKLSVARRLRATLSAMG